MALIDWYSRHKTGKTRAAGHELHGGSRVAFQVGRLVPVDGPGDHQLPTSSWGPPPIQPYTVSRAMRARTSDSS